MTSTFHSIATRLTRKILSRFARARIDDEGEMAAIAYRGLRLRIPLEALTPNIRKAFETGTYETHEMGQVEKIVTPNDTVMEIGSGVGFLAAYMKGIVGAKRVVTYEANPKISKIAEETYRLNDLDVEQVNAVLGPYDGECPFYLHRDFWSSSLVFWYGAEQIMVPMRSFDAELARVKPDIMVVDIEGGEVHFFNTIAALEVPKLLIEIHPHVVGEEGVNELRQRLHQLGYAPVPKYSLPHVIAYERIADD